MLANVFTKTIRDRWRAMAIAVAALVVMLLLAMSVYANFDFSFYDDLPEAFRSLMNIPDNADAGSLAIGVLAVVVIRLVGNPLVLEYEGSVLGTFGWVLYGYGLPAVATFYAARTFAREERDLTVTLCEIASIGFAFLAVMGIAVSNIVMFGLILAVGMLVDGAIVVVEYADKRLQAGARHQIGY